MLFLCRSRSKRAVTENSILQQLLENDKKIAELHEKRIKLAEECQSRDDDVAAAAKEFFTSFAQLARSTMEQHKVPSTSDSSFLPTLFVQPSQSTSATHCNRPPVPLPQKFGSPNLKIIKVVQSQIKSMSKK